MKIHVTSETGPASNYEIPEGYNIDTIVLMPVNMDTSFVYWEVTGNLLSGNKKKLESGSAKLMVKVYEDEGLNEICSFEVMDRIGKSYVNYQPSFKPLVAEIGVVNGKGFACLLKSRTVSSPSGSPAETSSINSQSVEQKHDMENEKRSTGPASLPEEVWMTNIEGESKIVGAPSAGKAMSGSEIIEYYREVSVLRETPLFSTF